MDLYVFTPDKNVFNKFKNFTTPKPSIYSVTMHRKNVV